MLKKEKIIQEVYQHYKYAKELARKKDKKVKKIICEIFGYHIEGFIVGVNNYCLSNINP